MRFKPTQIQKYVNKQLINLEINPSECQQLDSFQAVGGSLWPCADVLVDYLTENQHRIRGRNVLELGSGCGFVGIASAILGAKSVTLTDKLITQSRMMYDNEGVLIEDELLQLNPSPALLLLSERNIQANRIRETFCPMDVRELTWGAEYTTDLELLLQEKQIDIIIGSDLTYHSSVSQHLFHTVSHALKTLSELDQNNSIVKNDPMNVKTDTAINPHQFLLAHQHRLDISTQTALNYARTSGLGFVELCRVDIAKSDFSVFEFSRNNDSEERILR